MGSFAINPILKLLDNGNFNGYVKINHGFWDILLKANKKCGWPKSNTNLKLLDEAIGREYFFEGNYVEELLEGVNKASTDIPGLEIVASLGDLPNREISQSDENESFLSTITSIPFNLERAMIFKASVEDGSILQFIKKLESKKLVVVAPSEHCSNSFLSTSQFVQFIEIPYATAIRSRQKILARTRHALLLAPDSYVIIQAGSLSAWLTTSLCMDFPEAKFLDLGIAANSFSPLLLASRNPGWYNARKSPLDQYFGSFATFMGNERSNEETTFEIYSYLSRLSQKIRAHGATMTINDIEILVKEIVIARETNENIAYAFSPLLTDIGKLLHKRGANEASLQCLKLAINPILPGFWQPLHWLSKVEIEIGSFDDALNRLESACQISKFEWALKVDASRLCLKMTNRQDALNYLGASLDLVDEPNQAQKKLIEELGVKTS